MIKIHTALSADISSYHSYDQELNMQGLGLSCWEADSPSLE